MAILDFLKRKPTDSRAVAKPRWAPVRAAMRMFDGAKQDRLSGDWLTHPVTSEWLIRMHQRVLVARSREQAVNNDYAKAFVRMCRQNIVGPKGVMLQAQSRDESGKLDTLANQAIEAAFVKWGHRNSCDVAGVQSWRSIQASAVISAVKDGEFMFRKITGKDAGPFGFALQVLDPQRCHPQFDQYDLPDGSFIRAGIEFNKYGRPIAYHFTVAKESDSFYNYSYAGLHYHRIPAEEIIHGFLPEMVGQKRGLPWMATGLFRMKQLVGFENAAIVNARIGASKMGVIQWKEGRGPDLDDEELEAFEMTAEPGEFPVLPEGAELHEWNPQYPSGEFATFNKAMLRGIAAGFGVLYNNLANDLEHVNFSSIRQGTLDEREHWKEMQEWLIEALIQPVFEAWLPRALLGGHIQVKGRPLKAERIDRYSVVSWQPRRWQWIDPRADVDAAIAAKNQMLLSPGQIIREQGRDPSDVWREIAADIQEMKAAGIPEEFIKAAILDKNLQATVQAQAAQAQAKGAE
ncbi:phage portal protein [Limnohabitans sp. MMS-10A-192]|uniref:phage portal protein n=1 Tax=Limnohabitans sp. MMS-10A-192 TaxID=1835769 RepID=UPI000D3904C5|nr:phage portal protein [Limnohabitans sp. MMS-10A-192]PUE21856.1 phage portal protein [Limnohabitans sp. MMS-10A-192]